MQNTIAETIAGLHYSSEPVTYSLSLVARKFFLRWPLLRGLSL